MRSLEKADKEIVWLGSIRLVTGCPKIKKYPSKAAKRKAKQLRRAARKSILV